MVLADPSRRLGSKLSTAKGPVPTAVVSRTLPSPPASLGMTPLYLPPRLARKVADGAESTNCTVKSSGVRISLIME